MSEGPPAYHVWHEGDQAWQEAHADWDIVTQIERDGLQDHHIAAAALPALTEMLRLWPFPKTDVQAVRELVRILQDGERTIHQQDTGD